MLLSGAATGANIVDLEEDDWDPDMPGLERWRWTCSCGRRGQWTIQSPNVPYHGWLRAHGWPHDTTAPPPTAVETTPSGVNDVR